MRNCSLQFGFVCLLTGWLSADTLDAFHAPVWAGTGVFLVLVVVLSLCVDRFRL